jgi:hypothetical protein
MRFFNSSCAVSTGRDFIRTSIKGESIDSPLSFLLVWLWRETEVKSAWDAIFI